MTTGFETTTDRDRMRSFFAGVSSWSPVLDGHRVELAVGSGDGRCTIRLHTRAERERDQSEPVWVIEMIGPDSAFDDMWLGRATLGEQLYRGAVRVRSEKALHNIVVALGVAIRERQEDLRGHRSAPGNDLTHVNTDEGEHGPGD